MLLFVVDNETRALASMVELSEYVAPTRSTTRIWLHLPTRPPNRGVSYLFVSVLVCGCSMMARGAKAQGRALPVHQKRAFPKARCRRLRSLPSVTYVG